MYQIRRYTDVNTMGTANLLQILADAPGRVRKLIVASSMSVYGEGLYDCPKCGRIAPRLRSREYLTAQEWELRCPHCHTSLTPVATDEDKPPFPSSIYAITKRDQEEMCLAFANAYRIPVVALRFFNIYGPRQALSNPYTGVLAIFSSRLLDGKAPLIFEDGRQLRDFVHVSDIVQACQLAMTCPAADYQVFNVGTGGPVTVLEVVDALMRELGGNGGVEVTRQWRAGDIRHCFADIRRIQRLLGYSPKVQFADGMRELVRWVSGQQGGQDSLAAATRQLMARALMQ
jgi:dTDP-L-rhamnose 4-epimerase